MTAPVFIELPAAANTAPARIKPLARHVPMGWLMGVLIGWLALDQLLLWQFLGAIPLWLTGLGVVASALLISSAARASAADGPTVATLLVCIAIAVLILALGGEGRFFYANPDWRLRDALLADMAHRPWPFAYATPLGTALLRAPIGMYLLPALGGKLAGQAGADLSLLAQNALLDGVLLAIGSTLFPTRRAKAIALGCFLSFSGMDIIGQLIRGHAALLTPTAHLEAWGVSQYSSTITLFFWVPQHAFAGWCGALTVLLWRTGAVRASVPLMLFPLALLWSPLAAMGLLPFMAWIAAESLLRRHVSIADLGAVGVALLLSLPSILYLKAGGDSVGSGYMPIKPVLYWLFEGVEVLPFLFAASSVARGRFGIGLFAIVTISLLLMPFGRVGWSIDFAMRASIPALMMLSLLIADALATGALSASRRNLLLFCMALGSLTGFAEITRALTFPVSPAPRCPLTIQWLGYKDYAIASSTYTTKPAALPPAMRPMDPAVVPLEPACHDPQWAFPALFH